MNLFKEKGHVYLIYALVGITFATLPAFTDFGKNTFYLLALVSLYYLFKNFKELKNEAPLLKWFFIVLAAGFAWTLITFYVNDQPDRGKSFIWGRQVYLLFIIPLYLMFKRVSIPFMLLWVSIGVGILLALYVGYQDMQVAGRAKGGMHPILFGSILLCMGAFMLMVTLDKQKLQIRVISFALFVVSMLLVIWTQSRGVWVATPVALSVILFFAFRRKFSKKVLAVVSVLTVAGIFLVINHPTVQRSYDRTYKNVTQYYLSENVKHNVRATSIGTRFEMWRAGWKLFLDNPVFGVGLGGYQEAVKAKSEEYGVHRSAYSFYHPHNQYISALSTKGIIGGLVIIALLVLPVLYAARYRNDNTEQKKYLSMIVALSAAYFMLGLSDVPFEGKAVILFYVLFMPVLLSGEENIQV